MNRTCVWFSLVCVQQSKKAVKAAAQVKKPDQSDVTEKLDMDHMLDELVDAVEKLPLKTDEPELNVQLKTYANDPTVKSTLASMKKGLERAAAEVWKCNISIFFIVVTGQFENVLRDNCFEKSWT